MLNGTAIALSRAMVAILENYQNEDGTVVRSVEQTKIGDQLMVSVSDGVLTTTVTQIKENAL